MTWLFLGGRWTALGIAALGWTWLLKVQVPPDPTMEMIELSAPVVRPIRILLGSRIQCVQIRSKALMHVRDADAQVLKSIPGGEWQTFSSPAASSQVPPESVLVVSETTTLAPTDHAAVEVLLMRDGEWDEPLEFPGTIVLSPGDDGALNVINHVDLEPYVACVAAVEAWPTFATEALRGQAIIARTFALSQMLRRNGQLWDVGSSQGSQVYRGVQRREIGRRAAAAASYTAGLVCVWNDGSGERLIPTYYSAACGGTSQSAAIFGPADNIAPLSGGVWCDYCRIAPGNAYRWGPVSLPLGTVWEKLSARFPEMHQVWPLAGVEVVDRAATGHARRVRLISASGAMHEMGGENFRLALGGATVKSTNMEVRVLEGNVVFENGRGYGHGLGLCQWGMQGQALAGKSAGDILRYYYPGTQVVRAY